MKWKLTKLFSNTSRIDTEVLLTMEQIQELTKRYEELKAENPYFADKIYEGFIYDCLEEMQRVTMKEVSFYIAHPRIDAILDKWTDRTRTIKVSKSKCEYLERVSGMQLLPEKSKRK